VSWEAWGSGEDFYEDNDHLLEAGWLTPEQAEEERQKHEAEIARLRQIIDVITGPPLTVEEAEAELDRNDLPELSPAERAACEAIDIEKILAYATDPANASPEWVVRRLIAASKDPRGLDRTAFDEAEAWLERRGI
jgi:hypothetical protein